MTISNRRLNIEYAFVQAFYWMGYCICISYATVFLQGRGYSNFSLGLVLAIGNIAGFLASSTLASLVDKGKGVTVYRCLWTLISIQVLLLGSFMLIRGGGLLLSLLYCLYVACNAAVNPMNTQLSFELGGWSNSINYSAARGMGSMAFAPTAMLLGSLTKRYNTELLPVMGIICLLLQGGILLVITLQNRKAVKPAIGSANAQEKPLSTLGFIRANPKFSYLLLGMILIFFSQNLISNFLINVVRNVGGDTAVMGRINGVMALAELPVMLLYAAVTRKLRCSSLLRFSMLVFVLKSLGVALAPTVGWLMAAQLLQSLSFGIFTPASVQYTSLVVGPRDSTKGQALTYSVTTLGAAFAGGLGGLLYDAISVRGALLVGVAICVVGAVICELCISNRANAD